MPLILLYEKFNNCTLVTRQSALVLKSGVVFVGQNTFKMIEWIVIMKKNVNFIQDI